LIFSASSSPVCEVVFPPPLSLVFSSMVFPNEPLLNFPCLVAFLTTNTWTENTCCTLYIFFCCETYYRPRSSFISPPYPAREPGYLKGWLRPICPSSLSSRFFCILPRQFWCNVSSPTKACRSTLAKVAKRAASPVHVPVPSEARFRGVALTTGRMNRHLALSCALDRFSAPFQLQSRFASFGERLLSQEPPCPREVKSAITLS